MKMEISEIRKLFVGMLQRVAELGDRPEWYNAFDRNCTTSIVTDVENILERQAQFSIDFYLNGYIL